MRAKIILLATVFSVGTLLVFDHFSFNERIFVSAVSAMAAVVIVKNKEKI